MVLENDCSALESIPLKLMIIAVVAALSVVPAAESLETLKTRDFVQRSIMQLEKIVSAAEGIAIEGPGNVRTIQLDFGGGGSVRFGSFSVGDEEGGRNMSSAILSLTNGARVIRSALDPPVWMMSPEGCGLQVSVPIAKLRMSCALLNNTWYVLVELV